MDKISYVAASAISLEVLVFLFVNLLQEAAEEGHPVFVSTYGKTAFQVRVHDHAGVPGTDNVYAH